MKMCFFYRYIFISLAMLLIPHTIVAATTQAKKLDTYYKHFKRGVQCVIERKPCTQEDKKAIYQAAGGIVALITVATGAIAAYVAIPHIRAYQERKKEEEYQRKLKKLYMPIVQRNISTLTTHPTEQQLTEAAECGICYDPLSGATVVKGEQCQHLWHYECLTDWAYEQKHKLGQQVVTCPICQQPLIQSEETNWYY